MPCGCFAVTAAQETISSNESQSQSSKTGIHNDDGRGHIRLFVVDTKDCRMLQ
ncbi:hypothetical protein ES707_21326 [subsurface metagenome]